MIVDRYLNLLPKIQERIEMAKLDAIVCGLGPTAWLLPLMRQSIFDDIHKFGAHDVCRMWHVNDVLILDYPQKELNRDSERYHAILKSKPDRFWLYTPVAPSWEQWFSPEMLKISTRVRFHVWPGETSVGTEPFRIDSDPPETIAVSPTGTTTLAWRLGCRRIGVIGMDMMPAHHSTFGVRVQVDAFMTKIAAQAHALGGMVLNLSPVTSLRRFAALSQQQFLQQCAAAHAFPSHV